MGVSVVMEEWGGRVFMASCASYREYYDHSVAGMGMAMGLFGDYSLDTHVR